jgi:hypothetical protein
LGQRRACCVPLLDDPRTVVQKIRRLCAHGLRDAPAERVVLVRIFEVAFFVFRMEANVAVFTPMRSSNRSLRFHQHAW